MEMQQLEFRGIKRSHLEMYFEELGGTKVSQELPIIFEGLDWIGKIVSEEEISITSTFRVNSIKVHFLASSKELLMELIRRYRYKTTRVGG